MATSKPSLEQMEAVVRTAASLGPTYEFIHACSTWVPYAIDQLKRQEVEIDRLHRVIARELSENDELGTEYVYVKALTERIARIEKALRDVLQC